jgi:DNA-binding CsgD family transcriptional regulator
MLALCTYPLQASGAAEVLDVARAHSFTLARRSGQWEFLQTPELQAARLETARLRGAADILSKPFPGRHKLAPRERAALSQIVRGATSKEAARNLGLSPRTIEYHRANIIKKLNAKNTADLVRKVLEGTNRRG